MKRYLLVLLGLIVVVAAGIWLVATRPVTPTQTQPPHALGQSPSEKTADIGFGKGRPATIEPSALPDASTVAAGGDGSTRPSIEEPPVTGLEPLPVGSAEAKERIQRLAATFDVAQVPSLARYLEHPLEDVRVEAATSLVLLGEQAAVPYLQSAANRAELTQSAVEASTMHDAAALLAKPRLNEPRMPKTPLSTGKRQEARIDRPSDRAGETESN